MTNMLIQVNSSPISLPNLVGSASLTANNAEKSNVNARISLNFSDEH